MTPKIGEPDPLRQVAGATEADAAPDDQANADLEADDTMPEPEQVNPYPHITEEQWEAREDARQFLENILSYQIETFDAQHHDLLRQSVAGPSPHERAAEIVPPTPTLPFCKGWKTPTFGRLRAWRACSLE